MTTEIYQWFRFEAAHHLPNVGNAHRCRRLHGHTYAVGVTCSGAVGHVTGWVQDFADVERAFAPVLAALDHHYLNEIGGLENPTSENLAQWIWNRLLPTLPLLVSVEVKETVDSGAVITRRPT